MSRGLLTFQISQLAEKKLGIKPFGTIHLRLLPYVHYCIVNHQNLEKIKLSEEERQIIQLWKAHRYLKQDSNRITASRKFYNTMNEIIWLGYVKDN